MPKQPTPAAAAAAPPPTDRTEVGPQRYAPLSWDAALAVRAGIIKGPFPEDFNGTGFDPTAPTTARPGTEEKIRVLAARYARRERLFHPRDAK
jgi:hypothetical protein